MTSFTVLISDHPIEAKNEQVIPYGLDDGDTLEKVIHLCPFKDFDIYHNDSLVYLEDWKHITMEDEDIVVLCPSPGIVGQIFVAIGSYLAANWVSIVVALSLSYLGGVLFNSQLPEYDENRSSDRKQKQSYGWRPRTTRAEGVAKPWSVGLNAHYGNIVSQWTDVDASSGNEELYVKLALGEGPTSGIETSLVWLNGQPVGNFTDVVVTEVPGTLSQSAMAGFEQDKLEMSVQKEITSTGGAYTINLPRAGFDDIEWTLEFRGLYRYNDMGDQLNASVTVKVEISDVAVTAWTTLFNEAITGNQRTSLYSAHAASDSSGFSVDRTKQYKLRVTKVTADKNSAKWGDHLYLRSVRGVVDVAFKHPGTVLVGIKALATELLNNTLGIKVLHRDRILRYYNGSSWEIDENHNRAWGVYNILTQPIISGTGSSGDPWVIDSYEGFQPSQIDTAFFYTWAQFCDQQKPDGDGGLEDAYPLHHIYDEAKELWSWAIETASIGRAHLYWQGTTLTGWLDNTASGTGDLICHQNIVEGSWRQEWVKQSDFAGGCIVTLQDASRGYKNIPWPTYNENGGTYTRTINIDGIGVKTRAFGSRIGEFVLERNKLIREIIKFTMIKDGLLYDMGEVYPVQHRKPNWGSSYQIMVAASAGASTLTLDRTITGSVGNTLYIRSYDSSSGEIKTESYNVSAISDTQVMIDDSGGLTYSAAHGDNVAIGTVTEIKLRRLIGKDTLPNHMFDMTMETYDPDLYNVDNLTPTIPYPAYTEAPTENKLIQSAAQWDARNIASQLLPPSIATDIPWIGNISWEVDSSGDITWSATDVDESLLFRLKGTSYEITADSYSPGSGENEIFFFWDPNFNTIFRETLVGSTAVASPNWMVATYKDGTIYPATPIQLLHAAVILAGTIRADQYAELRQTMAWNSFDSCDSSYPGYMDFKLPSELTSIVSVKLSFQIQPFRAYSTTTAAGGSSVETSDNTDLGTKTSTGPADWSPFAATGNVTSGAERTTDAYYPGFTGYHTESSHSHTMGQHDHDITAAPNTDNENLGTHNHTQNQHRHTIDIDETESSGHTQHLWNNLQGDYTTATNQTANLSTHNHGMPTFGWTLSNEDPGDTDVHSPTQHRHSLASHTHEIPYNHTHDLTSWGSTHTHNTTIGSHNHDVTIPGHNHGITFGIYEETNAINLTYNIDNGSGFGAASPSYSSDQTDLDISGGISGAGWKRLKFNVNNLCRISAIVEVKVDITA